jgi:hypothetical protein
LPPRDRLQRPVDGGHLVVARRALPRIRVVGGEHKPVAAAGELLPGPVLIPEDRGGRKRVQGDARLYRRAAIRADRPVVEHEGVPVAGEREGHAEHGRVVQGLLDARLDRMRVVLRLHDGDRHVPLELQHVVRAPSPIRVPPGPLPPHHDAPRGQGVLLPDLRAGLSPSRRGYGGPDESIANFRFGQLRSVLGVARQTPSVYGDVSG